MAVFDEKIEIECNMGFNAERNVWEEKQVYDS